MLGPLVAWHLQAKWGLAAVSLCGPSSGPKVGPNLLDVARELGVVTAPFAHTSADIADRADPLPEFGWYVDQRDVSPPLAAWIERRRNIIKRPFFATSEKYMDPFKADIVVASAFHPSFTDKMVALAEARPFSLRFCAAGFPACIMIRRGMEGSLGFSLGNPVDLACAVRGRDGRYRREDISFGPADLGMPLQGDKLDRGVTAAASAAKCREFAARGASGDEEFDKRARVTVAGMDQALKWVLAHLPN
ncbi:unnamed protein product [Phaeothamnion confervicola]